MSSKKNKHTNIITEKQTLLTSEEPQKVLEYKIVTANSAEELSSFVNQHLQEGWEVSGGVSTCIETSPYHSRIVFAQSLVK
jgi:hypothetical protein